ncbi:putative thiol-disulfide isomerase and thioredoxin [Bacteroides coprosuis DSM 18011]|uniref:Putative thiol-disulfide isomerase and thioredoxin n=1 Tax=Bacteroides coprosuis DSM 18011 TaxID=679937 RepID=F3ZQM1_9BACE|nr:thioredoxin family protein [Bacteroides coprosuis]EGJ71816.1 putative thiol-disulfide isomerase and thioredoxin [Bacteroides coprosuis DSM 18011]
MEIIVLGTGCTKCKNLFNLIQKVAQENNVEVHLSKLEDMAQILQYNVLSLPAVVVDGKVVLKGVMPTENQVKEILKIG